MQSPDENNFENCYSSFAQSVCRGNSYIHTYVNTSIQSNIKKCSETRWTGNKKNLWIYNTVCRWKQPENKNKLEGALKH